MEVSQKPESTEGDSEKVKERTEPADSLWSDTIFSGLFSAVIAGLAAGFGGGNIGFVTWLVCYALFFSWLTPFNRKVVAIAIMIVLANIISIIIQEM